MPAVERVHGAARDCGQRIIVVGASCTGKSSLAEDLAQLIDAPFVELDALFWLPGWKEPEEAAFRERIEEATQGERWVVAGNYLRHVMPVAWGRAETIIWLDLPLHVTTWRVLRRSWRRWRRDELLWGTNHERFWQQLKLWDARASLIRYNVENHRRRRAQFETAMADPQWTNVQFIRLRSGAAVQRFRGSLEGAARPSRGSSPVPRAG